MNKKEISSKNMQDIGICVLLLALLATTFVFAACSDTYIESLVMVLGIFISVMFACFKLTGVAIVIAGLLTVAMAAYKIYLIVITGTPVAPISFLWLIIPAAAVFGSIFFVNGLKKIQIENQVLKDQVEELVMIDPLTGFYNLRSMFMDIQTQISYAERNGKAISLMIIKLRYIKELKSVLKKSQFEDVMIRLSKVAFDTVRLEDRVYSIDSDGTLGIILTCDRTGSKSVEARLRKKLDNPEVFEGVAASPIRVEVKIGCLQYKKDEFQRDAMLFKERVEEEVEYDI